MLRAGKGNEDEENMDIYEKMIRKSSA